MISIKNCMEEIARERLAELLVDKADICTCEQCRAEMLTYALNHLPPRYVSSVKGEVFTRTQNLDYQYNADVVKALLKAIQIVSANPRHKNG